MSISQGLHDNDTINVHFTFEEISDHIKSLKNNKSPGIDHILNEFIKHCPNELILVIVKLFNVILDSGIIPSEWTIGIIKPLYNKLGLRPRYESRVMAGPSGQP